MVTRVVAPILFAATVAGTLVLCVVTRPSGPSATPPVATSERTASEAHASANLETLLSVAATFSERVGRARQRLTDDPGDRELALQLARLLHDGHRVREALQYYRRAIDLDPTGAPPYYDLAAAHAALGEWEAARDVLVGRLEEEPDDGIALHDLGAVLANARQLDEARSRWRRVLEVSSDPDLRSRTEADLARLDSLVGT